MLAALGPVIFDLKTDLQSISSKESSSWAKHEVMGAPLVYEDTGDGESTVTLKGTIHPYHFGGLGGLAALRSARAAKMPLPLMRGDFTPLGWFVINEISRDDSDLSFEGIGKEIDYTVDLLRVDGPGGAESLLRLFL